jgi:PPOX class probable F420-dependent enzyme
MTYTDQELAFLEKNHRAAMVTLRADGTPHTVRVAVVLVDGMLWSSGVPGRVRTRHLRRDPRCTLFVFDSGYASLTVEGRATILDGPDAAEQNLRLFQIMQSGRKDPNVLTWNGQEKSLDAFLQAMRDEQRLIYAIEPRRTYGLI